MNDLIVFALEDEAPGLFKYKNVFEVGVGKVNSGINTMRLILKHRPKRVINFGTAGGITVKQGIYRIARVIQHDVNLTPLGLEPGLHLTDRRGAININDYGATCGSGDIFVTEPLKLRVACDMVEMEAYSIAKAAEAFDLETIIYKYISDKADNDANTTWKDSVADGEVHYTTCIKKHDIELLL
jgi:adenosylhomocysteine nucleosidase